MIAQQPRRHHRPSPAVVCLCALLIATVSSAGPTGNDLIQAARNGDLPGVTAALDAGVDVNTLTEYRASALTFAAEKGHVRIVKLLIDRGADVNMQDTFFSARPINWAARNGHAEVIELLLANGSILPPDLLNVTISRKQRDVARVMIASGRLEPDSLRRGMEAAQAAGDPELVQLLARAGAPRVDFVPTYDLSADELNKFVGTYVNARDLRMTIVANEKTLTRTIAGMPPLTYRPVSPLAFQGVEYPGVKVNFTVEDGQATKFDVISGRGIYTFLRVTADTPGAIKDATGATIGSGTAKEPRDSATVDEPKPWPSFRGVHATGIADGQHPPITWDVDTGKNVKWKTPIPGLAHSSPIVWGDHVFVTTVVSAEPDPDFRPGLYGDVDSADDDSKQTWRVYCLDKSSGRIRWERVAHEGVPRSRRHLKASHANCTPVTDGTHVVASFGSEGLYCYDMNGNLAWRIDLGTLNSGWFFDTTYQWGFASSPIIHNKLVIVQVDHDEGSFIAAYSLDDGKQVWRTPREELPSWGTPTIFENSKRTELVTNATKYVRGYDPDTGKELWRLGGNSEITVATPVPAKDLIFVTGGYAPIRPIYAIRAGATGDITLEEDAPGNDYVAWWNNGMGTYLPTPIVYRDRLYTCKNSGTVACYAAGRGDEIFRTRVGGGVGSGYAASPVAADGRLYFTSEDGDVFVIKAGVTYELIAHNKMDEVCMATPAISDGMIFIRTVKHLYGLGQPGNKSGG